MEFFVGLLLLVGGFFVVRKFLEVKKSGEESASDDDFDDGFGRKDSQSATEKEYSAKCSTEIPAGFQIFEDDLQVHGLNVEAQEGRERRKALVDLFKNGGGELEFDFESDPQNHHDKNAIKFIAKSNGRKYHVGFVPAEIAQEIAEKGFSGRVQPRVMSVSWFESKRTGIVTKAFVRFQLLGPKGEKKTFTDPSDARQ